MGRLLDGEIINSKIKVEYFGGESTSPEEDIAELVNAHRVIVLKRDFYII
jgi:hypothetical protein